MKPKKIVIEIEDKEVCVSVEIDNKKVSMSDEDVKGLFGELHQLFGDLMSCELIAGDTKSELINIRFDKKE